MHSKFFKRTISALFAGAMCLCGTLSAMPCAFADESSVSYGDVNSDDMVDASDASEVLFYYAQLAVGNSDEWSDEKFKTADVNADGKVDAGDASSILAFYSYASIGGEQSPNEFFGVEDIEKVNFDSEDLFDNIGVKESYSAAAMQVGLRWNDIEGATGYHVDFYTDQQYDSDGKPFVYSRDVSSPQFTAQLPAALQNNAYRYRITPYAKSGRSSKYSEQSYTSGTWDHASIAGYTVSYDSNIRLLVNAADLKSHKTYPMYNVKQNNRLGGTPYFEGYENMADYEIDIYEDFAAEHFTDGMTNYDKIWYLIDWMHENVSYVLTGSDYVQSCLVDKMGQCIQYNGALADILCYMGYDAYMIEMWTNYYPDGSGYNTQHFRCECEIDGIPFSLEVGDKASDNPPTGYRWCWTFDYKQAVLTDRPEDVYPDFS